MACDHCITWCAVNEVQLANRLRNMGSSPEARPYPCPQCGSIDWATTRELIGAPKVWAPTKPRWRLFIRRILQM